jgi:hypothetical protein
MANVLRGDAYYAHRRRLAESASNDLWALELWSIVLGDRDFAIERVGSVPEYVDVLIAEGTDAATTRASFAAALRDVVQVWQPDRRAPDSHTLRLLQLVNVYTPPEGFQKLVRLVEALMASAMDGSQAGRDSTASVLRLALAALHRYYTSPPTTPPWEGDAYATYIRLLRAQLSASGLAASAVARLYELNQLALQSEDVRRIIVETPDAVTELLRVILTPSRRIDVAVELGLLYGTCLSLGPESTEVLKNAAGRLSVRLEHGEGGATAHLGDGSEIHLALPASDMGLYMAERHSEISSRFREIWEGVEGGDVAGVR